jgi:hypothetical protein
MERLSYTLVMFSAITSSMHSIAISRGHGEPGMAGRNIAVSNLTDHVSFIVAVFCRTPQIFQYDTTLA